MIYRLIFDKKQKSIRFKTIKLCKKKKVNFKDEFDLKAGIKISSLHSGSGTLGAIVYKSGKPMLLTNAHVVKPEDDKERKEYSSNKELMLQRAQFGRLEISEESKQRIEKGETPVFHPPYEQGENEASRIIGFVSEMDESVDAALVELVVPAEHIDRSIGYTGEYLKEPVSPAHNQEVFKHGAVTGRTVGKVEGLTTDTMVIRSQNGNKPFSDHGDSGSTIMTMKNDQMRPVGLLHKGKNGNTFAFPMIKVQEKLGFTFKKQQQLSQDLSETTTPDLTRLAGASQVKPIAEGIEVKASPKQSPKQSQDTKKKASFKIGG